MYVTALNISTITEAACFEAKQKAKWALDPVQLALLVTYYDTKYAMRQKPWKSQWKSELGKSPAEALKLSNRSSKTCKIYSKRPSKNKICLWTTLFLSEWIEKNVMGVRAKGILQNKMKEKGILRFKIFFSKGEKFRNVNIHIY